jgi:hypothetical protein
MKFLGYYNDETNKPETIIMTIRPLGITFKSGDWVAVHVQPEMENLEDTFHIIESRYVPRGQYWFTRYSLEVQTFEGRSISAYAVVKNGGYYDGSAWSFHGSLSWNLSRYFNLSCDFERNAISINSGRFNVDIVSGRFDVALNPKLNAGFFGQWNNVDKVFLLNFRLNWIPVVGSDFYLAVNQAAGTEKRPISLRETAILGKFIWSFTI